MYFSHLQTQYSTIYSFLNGENKDITLFDMANILNCTQRNARIVLNKMVEQGWLSWEPAVGRGKRSRLTFHCSEIELQKKQIRQWQKSGKLKTALHQADSDKLVQLIQAQLGAQIEEKNTIIRLVYSRSFACLNPNKNNRFIEKQLISQIFNCLTIFDKSSQKIKPDLAYYWEALSDRHWRFYLRPSIKFHDGTWLNAQDVISSLNEIIKYDYFAHIETILSPANNVVDFYLTKEDEHFALTLSSPMASIQRHKKYNSKQYDRYPIGTGPYKIEQNNDQGLILNVHDDYFALRALIDSIEIWMFDNVSFDKFKKINQLKISNILKYEDSFQTPNASFDSAKLCCYLLLNRTQGIAKDPQWANYLSQCLSSTFFLSAYLKKEKNVNYWTNAYGLMPQWYHFSILPIKSYPTINRALRLVYDADNLFFPVIANTLKQLLQNEGILLEIEGIQYEDIAQAKYRKQIDIWLCENIFFQEKNEEIFSWLMIDGLIKAAMPKKEYEEIKEKMNGWRGKNNNHVDVQDIGKILIKSNQIIPLFHYSEKEIAHYYLENGYLNDISPFDLTSLWVNPSI